MNLQALKELHDYTEEQGIDFDHSFQILYSTQDEKDLPARLHKYMQNLSPELVRKLFRETCQGRFFNLERFSKVIAKNHSKSFLWDLLVENYEFFVRACKRGDNGLVEGFIQALENNFGPTKVVRYLEQDNAAAAFAALQANHYKTLGTSLVPIKTIDARKYTDKFLAKHGVALWQEIADIYTKANPSYEGVPCDKPSAQIIDILFQITEDRIDYPSLFDQLPKDLPPPMLMRLYPMMSPQQQEEFLERKDLGDIVKQIVNWPGLWEGEEKFPSCISALPVKDERFANALKEAIKHENFYAFRMYNARNYHESSMAIMKFLITQATDPFLALDAIAAEDFEAFRWACRLEASRPAEFMMQIVGSMSPLYPEHMSNMIKANSYQSLQWASKAKNLELVLDILEKIPQDDMKEAIKALPPRWVEVLENPSLKRHEVYQELGGGAARWQAITNAPPPFEYLEEHSPYGFKRKLFDKLLPAMKTLVHLELSSHKEAFTYHSAYVLSVLFSNEQEIEKFYQTHQSRDNMPKGRETSPYFMGFDFALPSRGLWTIPRWKGLIQKYGTHVIGQYIEHAPKIERFAEENGLEFPKTVSEVREYLALSYYTNADKDPELAKTMFGRNAKGAARYTADIVFDRARSLLKRAQTDDLIPNTIIHGRKVGIPGIYMHKLAADDPRCTVLGTFTDDCTQIQNNGEGCMEHAIKSKRGGFYVWQRQAGQEPDHAKDLIIAQSWVWVGRNGEVVFDSFEAKGANYLKLARPFLEQFAYETNKEVRLGTTGKTPVMALPITSQKATLPGYDQYSDARTQYTIKPVDHKSQNKRWLTYVTIKNPD